ncbi:hypothetical protein B0H19DRAFT_1106772 [Mycena capillaripes]|nr:hypothetical protein B0H19DRAFT_1106772 [Mycena capillaripes]
MSYETLPTAQQAIDEEYLRAAQINPKAYVCSNCSLSPPNTTLKLCAKCKLTRYCSKDCQKIHWKQHKYSCQLGAGDVERNVPQEYRAQKFAEQLTHIPWLMILIDMYAVVALQLDVDRSNAARSCLCARITVEPVPVPLGGSKPTVMLQFERFEIKPVSVLTESMRTALRKLGAMGGDGMPPPVLLYFSSDGDNFLFSPHQVLEPIIRHAAMRPVFDDGLPITQEKVVAELNEFIRLDTNNLCKLRGPLLKS